MQRGARLLGPRVLAALRGASAPSGTVYTQRRSTPTAVLTGLRRHLHGTPLLYDAAPDDSTGHGSAKTRSTPGGGPVPEPTSIMNGLSLLPTPPNPQGSPRFDRHDFDTQKIAKMLETNGDFTRKQSVILMLLIRSHVQNLVTTLQRNMLSRQDLDNESYLFKAALSELRTESQILQRNDASTLRAEQETVSRDLNSLENRIKEEVGLLKSDIQIDFNTRKFEVSQDHKTTELRIREVNDKAIIILNKIRTEMEAMKMTVITRVFGKVLVQNFWFAFSSF